MGELRVAEVMNRTVAAVRRETAFKDVVCALLAAEAGAVPVVDDDGRPIGTVAGAALLTKLEFHGGTDARPIRSGAARVRWHQSSARTAGDLMAGPPESVYGDLTIGRAAARLAESSQPLLCVVGPAMRLVGVLTPSDLLGVYQRSDGSLAAEIRALVDRPPDTVTVHVHHGVVTLAGSLTFRSRTEHATYAVTHVPGVVAVHNNLTYDLDDLAITGF
ncbi:CBS domain-containing protein [Kribbella turkmenica]|uniref:CBS domain-containing protein n=1 Tax=Kribbella turkmenica TaxID=2530375 RepID=A0A4R4WJK7_9ACTN|nr:CBS domain-containing protein [Kribbella turkmenica]TDD17667.1 CBS domain-containing protein [Kribbella turkmenica]